MSCLHLAYTEARNLTVCVCVQRYAWACVPSCMSVFHCFKTLDTQDQFKVRMGVRLYSHLSWDSEHLLFLSSISTEISLCYFSFLFFPPIIWVHSSAVWPSFSCSQSFALCPHTPPHQILSPVSAGSITPREAEEWPPHSQRQDIKGCEWIGWWRGGRNQQLNY